LRGEPELTLEQALARLSPCDIALVEGYKTFPIPKLEIWRTDVGKPLLHPRDPHILAIATDSPQALPEAAVARLPILGLSEYDAVATFILAHAVGAPVQD
jgi:molybdopterin-guanine dinucleotide biosynthesis protein B